MVKTPDDNKVVVIHTQPSGGEDIKGKASGEKQAEKEKKKGRSKINKLAIIDVISKKTIANHKINHSPFAGRFITTKFDSEQKDSSKKEVILDGLVLITEASGLIRGGEAVDDQTSSSIDQALRIEQELGISTQLPFQELFQKKLDHHPSDLQLTQLDRGQTNNDQELDFEFDRLVDISPHLVPPSRLLWSSLIRPSKRPPHTPNQSAQANGFSSQSQQDHSLPATHLLSSSSDSSYSLDHRLPLLKFNQLLLSKLNHDIPLEPLKVHEVSLSQ
jgi:hypothetical protein